MGAALGLHLLVEALREYGPGSTVGCIQSFLTLSLVDIVFELASRQLISEAPLFTSKKWCDSGSLAVVCKYVYNQQTLLIAYIERAGDTANVYVRVQSSTYLSLSQKTCNVLFTKTWRELIVPQMAHRQPNFPNSFLELTAKSYTIHTNWKKMRGSRLI
jgi:hypothetical protein